MESRGSLPRRGQAGGRRWRRARSSINHPSDLRRRGERWRRSGGAGPAGGVLWPRTSRLLSCPFLTPEPRQGAMNSHVLLHLLERWQTKELLLLPPALPLTVFFLLLLARLSRKTISSADKFRVVFLFFLQLSANKGATCYTEAAPSQGNASKTGMFFFFCKFLHAHSQCLRCRVKKPKAAICGVIVPSDWKAALASESDGVLSV